MKNKIIVFFILIFISFPSLLSASPWTKNQIYSEISWEVLNILDWGTTRDIVYNKNKFKETNIFLGEKPGIQKVDMYFISWIIFHPFITRGLPSKYRKWWLGGSIFVTGSCVANNLNLGLKINF